MGESDKIHLSIIRGGQFQSRNVRRLVQELEGHCCEVVIRPQRKYAGLQTRADYWGNIIPPIAYQLRAMDVRGHHGGPITDKETHDWLSETFLLRTVLQDPTTGTYESRSPSITELTEEEFNSYKHIVIAWAYDFFGHKFKFPERHEYTEFTLA